MLQDLSNTFSGLAQRVIQVFPLSPFRGVIDNLSTLPALGYLNWFFPVSECLTVMVGWLAAIAVFYLWSVVARWVKLIGG